MCYIFQFGSSHSLSPFVCGIISTKSSTAEKCRSEAENSDEELQVERFFFRGRMCKLTGKIICACACQHFSPFASFKASLFNFSTLFFLHSARPLSLSRLPVVLCCAHAFNGLANVWEVRSYVLNHECDPF